LVNMFVGLLTGPLRDWSLQKLTDWASTNGFRGLEVAVAPSSKQLDVDGVLEGGAGEVRRALAGKDVEITSLAFYSMRILESPDDQKFLNKVFEAASALDIKVVCTMAGGPAHGKSKLQTLREDFPQTFNLLVDKAKEHEVKIALENWFATNLQGLDHFQTALEAVPDKTLGLNFDPSHLVWQQIDCVEAVYRFGERIYHTHAKVGVLGQGWWRYRIPGWGSINWSAYITALKAVKYDYVLSIEHEDPFFGPEEGFLSGKRYLQNFLETS